MAASERLYELWLLYYAQVSLSRPWSARPPDPRVQCLLHLRPAPPPPTSSPAAERRAHAGHQPRTHVRALGRRAASGICARDTVRGHALYCKSPSDTAQPRITLTSHFSPLSQLGKLRPGKKGTQSACWLFRLRGAFAIGDRG